MAKTLLDRAIDIRDEVTEFQNTAERVGSVLVEVVEKHTALEPRVDELESRSDDMLRDVTLHRQEIAELKRAGATMRDELDDQQMEITDHGVLLDKHNRTLSMYPAQMMMDLGTVDTQDAGLALAARSEIAGNRNISFIRFQINIVQILSETLVTPNGIILDRITFFPDIYAKTRYSNLYPRIFKSIFIHKSYQLFTTY